jgi:hypothetical protein
MNSEGCGTDWDCTGGDIASGCTTDEEGGGYPPIIWPCCMPGI